MSIMTLDGYNARIEYDADLDLFRGDVLGLNGGANFYGKNPKELRAEFKKSLQVFLDVCREKGLEPRPELLTDLKTRPVDRLQQPRQEKAMFDYPVVLAAQPKADSS